MIIKKSVGGDLHGCSGLRFLSGQEELTTGATEKHSGKQSPVFLRGPCGLLMTMQALILDLSEMLWKKTLSPVELTQDCLIRIEKLNPRLNAFITVTSDSALAQARRAEEEIAGGNWRGPLHGIPLALKDLIDTAGVRTTAASALFKDRVPANDAEVVRRLKAAGAVLLGKHNLHECAYGGSSMISHYGEVHNPWNPAHIAGGSSGGSAAAAAAGMCYGAIGTDTAGSVREPAALCGMVGLKPTYGRVSARGVIPLSKSLDHLGTITRTVEDAAIMLQAIAGHDGEDPTSSDSPVSDYLSALGEPSVSLRIGVPRAFFFDELDPEVNLAAEWALSELTAMGNEIREIQLQVPTDRTLSSAEAYAYHAEFIAQSPELYHPETLRRLQTGSGINAADLAHSRQELEQARRDIAATFEQVDVIVTPTTPIPAPTIAELAENPDQLRPRELLLLRNTRPFNVWGLPTISIPCGSTEAGLPIGLQIAGPHWEESRVLRLAHAYEQSTAWHKRMPKYAGIPREGVPPESPPRWRRFSF
jgi:aspartyl-tRNA(Asn)/glutamyl-tRNA(Gln) amidotransferase subunit A